MNGQTYGYIRLPEKGASLAEQRNAMIAYGVSPGMIVTERGGNGYRALCERMKPGDTVVVKNLGQIGRDYEEILEKWRFLTKTKRVFIALLDTPLLSTGPQSGGYAEDIVLELLAYVTEAESESASAVHERQAVGIAVAKAKGVRFGRPLRTRPPHYEEVYREWAEGRISGRSAAARLGVAPMTFKKWAMETG